MDCPRTWLLIPADKPDRIAAALASGADAIILDLEDGVSPSRKREARSIVRELLTDQESRSLQIWVRINGLDTDWWHEDVLCALTPQLAGLVIPKATPQATQRLDDELNSLEEKAGLEPGRIGLLPIATETAQATLSLALAVAGYQGRSDRLRGLTWGVEDLVLDLGALAGRAPDGSYTPVVELARSLLILGAASARVPAIETAFPGKTSESGLAAYVERARRDGFLGMIAVDPVQVPVIHEAFEPSAAERLRAERIIAAFEGGDADGTAELNGKILYAPHLAQARNLVARSRAGEQ